MTPAPFLDPNSPWLIIYILVASQWLLQIQIVNMILPWPHRIGLVLPFFKRKRCGKGYAHQCLLRKFPVIGVQELGHEVLWTFCRNSHLRLGLGTVANTVYMSLSPDILNHMICAFLFCPWQLGQTHTEIMQESLLFLAQHSQMSLSGFLLYISVLCHVLDVCSMFSVSSRTLFSSYIQSLRLFVVNMLHSPQSFIIIFCIVHACISVFYTHYIVAGLILTV